MKKYHPITKVAIVVIPLLIFVLIWVSLPKFPQPEYDVDSYEELTKKMAGNSKILLPKKEVLPDSKTTYTVSLVTRTWYDVNGYQISTAYPSPQNSRHWNSLDIGCRDQSKFEDEYAKFAPNGEIAGYEVLFSDYGSIIFYLDDFRYEVDPPYGVAHAMEEIAVPIAESILEQRTK